MPAAEEVYLDWNATTPPLPAVVSAMSQALGDAWANPSSVHAAGRRARARLEQTREMLAELLGVSARDVLFTSGGTEANNLALASAPALITSRIEHPSVTRVAENLSESGRFVHWLRVPESGCIEPEAVRDALAHAPDGSVVALMAANHETGVVQRIAEVSALCRAAGARLHVDAVQAFGKLAPERWAGADSVAVSAHKLRGPKGVGALICRPGWSPTPVLRGGAQERGLRPGTLDAVALVGFCAALEHAAQGPRRYAQVALLRDWLEQELARNAVVNGNLSARLPHVTNLSFPGWRGDELVAALDLLGVRVSSGSACSAGTTEPSATVAAMLGRERAMAAVRISLGDDTTRSELEQALSALHRILAVHDSCGSRSA